jgi:hypothetical protein
MTRKEAEMKVAVDMNRGDIENECERQCIDITSRFKMEEALIEALCGEFSAPNSRKARNHSLHCKKDGRIFQMRSGSGNIPIPFSSARHNYTKKDLDSLKVGDGMGFMPMFGNERPVHSNVIRVK